MTLFLTIFNIFGAKCCLIMSVTSMGFSYVSPQSTCSKWRDTRVEYHTWVVRHFEQVDCLQNIKTSPVGPCCIYFRAQKVKNLILNSQQTHVRAQQVNKWILNSRQTYVRAQKVKRNMRNNF